MRVSIDNIDGPEDLAEQAPVIADLIRQMPGPDRPDYWIAALSSTVTVGFDNHDPDVTHLILAAWWHGTEIGTGMKHIPVAIAYVTDISVLNDQQLSFSECRYVALGTASDISGDRSIEKLTRVMAGHIRGAFGV